MIVLLITTEDASTSLEYKSNYSTAHIKMFESMGGDRGNSVLPKGTISECYLRCGIYSRSTNDCSVAT